MGGASDGEDGGEEVDHVQEAREAAPGLQEGAVEEGGHPDPSLIDAALAPPQGVVGARELAVLPLTTSVVRYEEDHCVVVMAKYLEGIHNIPNCVIKLL